ncbi:MAG: formylglycine-generating enzyme family protein [Candidatus Nitrohelix vancouverensis]|uniref:Formylglycine-generating enzyme family protein n=1 Tax=Candidatus Nitrohelix vancouverensis TaxID=2705534 RepID=A0A7T0C3W4_9BACT|nr:MAG: formylglycine-generating enzyme family protein [Candidatus Nitrohelix vancouverensis]
MLKSIQSLPVLIITLLLTIPQTPAWGSSSALEDMKLIKGGCYKMGTDKVFWYNLDEWDNTRERPAHKVCLNDFYMDIYEAWQGKWEKVMGHHNSVYKGADLPVSGINWREAREFCHKQGKRLPTEAEWEYAARAGTQTDNPWGDGINDDYLWWGGNSYREYPRRGTKKPNAWGLHDMMGSVWEWVEDWYSVHYYEESPVDNPKGPTEMQSWRVIRGASWIEEEKDIRVTIRMRGLADATEDFWVGVRCAKSASK